MNPFDKDTSYPCAVRNETDFFHSVIDEIKSLKTRTEISISEIPAPQRLAPFAYAISADLIDGDIDVINKNCRGLLHDCMQDFLQLLT